MSVSMRIAKAAGESPQFAVGDAMLVATRQPIGHFRVPNYVRGRRGRVESVLEPRGINNEEEGFGRNAGIRIWARFHTGGTSLVLLRQMGATDPEAAVFQRECPPLLRESLTWKGGELRARMTHTDVKGWLIALTLVAVFPGVLRAQRPGDTPPDTRADVERLETFVHTAAQEARTARRASLVAITVAGGALVPAGIVIARRPDELSQSIGIGMTFGGAIPLAFAALSLSPSPMEKFEARFDARRKGGMLSADLTRITTNEWRDLARVSHERRRSDGARRIAMGLVATAIGVGFLRERPIGSLSRTAQYSIGSVLVGSGVPILQLGIRTRYQASPQETWWDVFMKQKP